MEVDNWEQRQKDTVSNKVEGEDCHPGISSDLHIYTMAYMCIHLSACARAHTHNTHRERREGGEREREREIEREREKENEGEGTVGHKF